MDRPELFHDLRRYGELRGIVLRREEIVRKPDHSFKV
jgi:hypothetical protein